jgi:hypothetical protein
VTPGGRGLAANDRSGGDRPASFSAIRAALLTTLTVSADADHTNSAGAHT